MSNDAMSILSPLTGADPAAGAEWSITLTKPFILYVAEVALVTDATVANRYPVLEILLDGTNIDFRCIPVAAHTASLTVNHRYLVGMAIGTSGGTIGAGNYYLNGLGYEALRLPVGAIVRSATSSIQAGDNYGVPKIWGLYAP